MTNKQLGILIFALLGLMGLVFGLYGAADMPVPRESIMVLQIVLFVSVFMWLRRDSKTDLGGIKNAHFVLACLWPIVLPYHMWKSRGRKGLLLTLLRVFLIFGLPILMRAVFVIILSRKA
jgi:hypothetical protein